MNRTLEKIYSKARRTAIALSWDKRPVSCPFISGDTFRKLADHIYDETQKCHAENVSGGETVFVKTDFVEDFFRDVHPRIQGPYKLITHNSDRNIDSTLARYADDAKIIRWFAQNVLVKHPKISPLPIGLENMKYYENGVVSRLEKLSRRETVATAGATGKKPRILFGFNPATNLKARTEALAALGKAQSADKIPARLGPKAYAELLSTYKFVAAPEGNGHDTHRVWEAALLGTVAIVKRSVTTEYFADLGLPLYIIDRWDEISNLSESDLARIYTDIMRRCGPIKDNLISLYYWQGRIRAPADKRDEAIVCVATGKRFREKVYEADFKKSQATLAHAIRRPLIVISEAPDPSDKRAPTWQKLLMWQMPILSDIERVMLLDADIYVKTRGNTAPENPFDLVPRGQWGLCPNNAFNLPTLAVTDLNLYEGLPTEKRPNIVLNCGMFLVEKSTHRALMEKIYNTYPARPCEEQGPLSFHLLRDFPGVVLPFRFNNIVASYIEKFGYSMTTVIELYRQSQCMHFTSGANRKVLGLCKAFERAPFLYRIMSARPIVALIDAIL